MKTLYILGIGSTAFEIRRSALLMANWDQVYCVAPEGETQIPKAAIDYDTFQSAEEGQYIFGMTDVQVRRTWNLGKKRKEERGNTEIEDYNFIIHNSKFIIPSSVIDPSSTVFETATIGAGTYIAAGAVVSHNSVIGEHCLINYNTVIGHDAIIGDHVTINPGASIGGNVHIGNQCLIGANSFIFQGKKIGQGSKIDALTYVDRDIGDNKLVTSRGSLKVLEKVVSR